MAGMSREQAVAFLDAFADLMEKYPLVSFGYTTSDDGVHIEFATDDKSVSGADIRLGFGVSRPEYLAVVAEDDRYPAICRAWATHFKSRS